MQVITRQEAMANATRRVPGTKTWRFTASGVRDFAWATGAGLRWDASVWNGTVVQTCGVHGCYNLPMPEQTVRDRILQALEELPPDATFDDAIERIVFLAKIEQGLAELDAGKGIPHDEVKKRLGL